MSHFTVLVIGDNPELQLEPFNENLEVDEYVEGVVSQEDLTDFKENYTVYKEDNKYGVGSQEEAFENSRLSFEELYDKHGYDWNNSSWEQKLTKSLGDYDFQGLGKGTIETLAKMYQEDEGKFEKVISKYSGKTNNIREFIHNLFSGSAGAIWVETSTYNPESKWDWYVVGGRWTGFFKNKVGNFVDSCKVGDIDFTTMFAENTIKSKALYAKYRTSMGLEGCGNLTLEDVNYTPWIDCLGQFAEVDAAKDFHNNQPLWVKFEEVANADGWHWLESNDLLDFLRAEEDFIKIKNLRKITSHAILKDGEWIERGSMGWFGNVSNEMDGDTWEDKYWELIQSLDPETIVTVYDCHI